jgi:alpha-D-ribose 1-methylphosphonate 5-triphosphate synthase subunit PhnL
VVGRGTFLRVRPRIDALDVDDEPISIPLVGEYRQPVA